MEKKIAQAELNLQRKLDWIGRYDSRITFVAGISIAMLGVLVNASASFTTLTWDLYLAFGFSTGLLFTSLILVYLSQYPKTNSVNSSLIYFGTIALLKADEFKKRVKATTEEDYFDDLLSQTHINAKIIAKKFFHLKRSLLLILIAVIPWLYVIYLSKIYLK